MNLTPHELADLFALSGERARALADDLAAEYAVRGSGIENGPARRKKEVLGDLFVRRHAWRSSSLKSIGFSDRLGKSSLPIGWLQCTMPTEDKAKNSDSGGKSGSGNLDSLIKGLLDKLFALFGIIIVAMVVSQLFAYPEFMIRSNTTYVEFTIPKSIVENNNDLWWSAKSVIPLKTITIEAKNYYNPYLKNYDYPIFLNYSFVDEKGTVIQNPGIEVKIEPKNRQIFADKERAVATIGLVGKVAIQDYNLRIWGRGGGGESFKIANGPQGSVSAESSGKEPLHYCTVTIILVNETKEDYTHLVGTNAKEILTKRTQGDLNASNNIAINPKIKGVRN
ncbi:MAG: hypothetical protein NTY37_11830 [Methanothrix sp.]|nr:hypothetical protein [Methanothrix sp.]